MNTEKQFPDAGFSVELMIQALACSPEATAIYSSENMIIRFANEGMLGVWGKTAAVVGKPLMEALPELDGQPFLALLKQVWHSGETYSVKDAPVRVLKNGVSTLDFYDYEYKALLNENGKTWCILNTARKVTSRKEYLQKIQHKEETEQALIEEMATTMEELSLTNEELNRSLKLLGESREHVKTIIEQAPVGIAMLEGPEHIIEIANPAILKIWGRKFSEVKGVPHAVARPELIGQPVEMLMPERFRQGHPTKRQGFVENKHSRPMGNLILAGLRKDGSEFPTDVSLSPLHTPEGMLITAAFRDITQQVSRENEMFSFGTPAATKRSVTCCSTPHNIGLTNPSGG
ncbi:MAG: PAS domain S-box protein, partial [Chryseobacterium sp.]